MKIRAILVALLAGLAFGAGLTLSGLVRPEVVLGFLHVTGPWDPTMGIVMAVAVTVNALVVRAALRRGRPVWGAGYALPVSAPIDVRLLVGAAIFGVGWGLLGVCPGPAIVGLATGAPTSFGFVGAMVIGMVAVDAVARRPVTGSAGCSLGERRPAPTGGPDWCAPRRSPAADAALR